MVLPVSFPRPAVSQTFLVERALSFSVFNNGLGERKRDAGNIEREKDREQAQIEREREREREIETEKGRERERERESPLISVKNCQKGKRNGYRPGNFPSPKVPLHRIKP